MKIILMGFMSAVLALIGYSIYEWIKIVWFKRKHYVKLVESLNFSEEVGSFLWDKDKRRINQLIYYDKNGIAKAPIGLLITKVSDTRVAEISAGLPKGYLSFICDFDQKNKDLAIIKGLDKYLILKTMQTHAEKSSLTNSNLIDELRKLDKICPFSIIGAGYDWVELAFETLPEDIGPLKKKLIALSPPSDDLAEFSAEIEEELKTTNKIFLGWPTKEEA